MEDIRSDILIYVIIFLLSVILVGSFLFLTIYRRSMADMVPAALLETQEEPEEEIIELIEETQIIATPTPEEPPRRSFLPGQETQRRSFLDREAPPQPVATIDTNLQAHEEQYTELVRQLRRLYGMEVEEEVIEEEPIKIVDIQAVFDSTLAVMRTQKDSLFATISLIRRENRALRDFIANRDRSIENLRGAIRDQSTLIDTLRYELNYLKENPIIVEVPVEIEVPMPPPPPTNPPDYRQLARAWGNMDAKKIATLIQEMPAEHSAQTIKLLNQRKAGQVMAALPPDVAAEISKLLIEF